MMKETAENEQDLEGNVRGCFIATANAREDLNIDAPGLQASK